jgi:hypothetical protein
VAAIAAAKRGKKTILVHPEKHLGGMSSGGLGATDMGNPEIIGGMAREFYQRLGEHYGVAEQWRFEPHVAEAVFNAWLKEAGVNLLQGALTAAPKNGTHIQSLRLAGGASVEARCFIDASYEGDLLAAAGVSYTVGREGKDQYGEDLAGVRAVAAHAGFKLAVDPWCVPGDPSSGLLNGVQADAGLSPGSADKLLQAYNYRLCLTQDENLFVPIAPPKDYQPARYELLYRYLKAVDDAKRPLRLSGIFLAVKMPHGKTDFNNYGAFSTDLAGGSQRYPEASPAERAAIAKAHEDYIRGLFHFLATDPRLPRHLQREARSWGLCKDEFQDTGGWPHQLYVREARRMLGSYVMTQADCSRTRATPHPVGMGSYTIDSHLCQRIVRNGAACNEGGLGQEVEPYPIALDSLLPQAAECENLVVPVCLSASHVAFGSIRMEPVFMLLAHAAGALAAIAVDGGLPVQSVDKAGLCAALEREGQVLSWDRAKSGWNKQEWPHDPFVFQSFLWWHE